MGHQGSGEGGSSFTGHISWCQRNRVFSIGIFFIEVKKVTRLIRNTIFLLLPPIL